MRHVRGFNAVIIGWDALPNVAAQHSHCNADRCRRPRTGCSSTSTPAPFEAKCIASLLISVQRLSHPFYLLLADQNTAGAPTEAMFGVRSVAPHHGCSYVCEDELELVRERGVHVTHPATDTYFDQYLHHIPGYRARPHLKRRYPEDNL